MAARTTNWRAPVPASSFRTGRDNGRLGRWIGAAIVTSVCVHLVLWQVVAKLGLPEHYGKSATTDGDRVPLDLRRTKINDEAAVEPAPPEPQVTEREIPPPTAEPVDVTQFKNLTAERLELTPKVTVPTNVMASKSPAVGNPDATSASLLASVPQGLGSDLLAKQISNAAARVPSDPKISNDQVLLSARDEKLPGDDMLDDSISAATKKGRNGQGDEDGFADLDDLINYSGPVTEDKTAMMPTDLLFEYNSSELKDTARLSLMKLGFIIQKNPDAEISIEGHTDTFGGDQYNQRLSEARAEAVKNWLTESLRFKPDRLQTRGWGKAKILVPGGSVEQQAKNRRVEIVIRPKH